MNRLQRVLADLAGKNGRALVGFIMAAQPDYAAGVECARVLEDAGCDILEIGVPYADPIADGEVIERAHFRGIAQGMNMSRALEFTSAVEKTCSLPLVMFSYYNPIYRRGLATFSSELRQAGADAVIIPDLPLEERLRLPPSGLDIIPMVSPASDQQRVARLDALAQSFVYCVSVAGVTGAREVLPGVRSYLRRVRGGLTHPMAVGFGISSPAQVRELREEAEAFVVGSLLVGIIERYAGDGRRRRESLASTVAALKAAMK
ncbi:MAG: tryptophan synthase subunit alpha [Syntrophomonadaceae bacterium]|nr:tryptophan synthase subunit alpha [Syntrophomonadaceae bacterium]MDH7498199.1 tryptophan synthase subunit alpha [Syntrophomonadaceae bacterium]